MKIMRFIWDLLDLCCFFFLQFVGFSLDLWDMIGKCWNYFGFIEIIEIIRFLLDLWNLFGIHRNYLGFIEFLVFFLDL